MIPSRLPTLPFWAAILVAAASGPIMDAGFPDGNLWPLTLVGIALVLLSLRGRRVTSAAVIGFIAGASFYFVHIQWAALFLGPLPMSALAVLESLFVAVGAMAIALAHRWIPQAWPGPVARFVLLPITVAGLWTAREAWSSVWPYGGFAWGRVALSQADGGFAPLFSWLGVSGVSFVMVLFVAVLLEVLAFGHARAIVIAPIAMAAGLILLPPFPVPSTGEFRVAAVQGNGRAGYFDRRTDGELLQAQLDATAPLFGRDVDVVLWPEGSAERDPQRDRYTAQVFDHVSEQLDAPLVGWAVTERDGKIYNTVLLWQASVGATDFYDKRHPVPFGEYVPDREFWKAFAPDLIDLIGRDYTPGTTDMVFTVDGTVVGVNVCFDIVDDQLMTETVHEGAEVIFASSNNADFGDTDESAQQLAIARIRAMELGRSVVNISTVGTSAAIGPDGSIHKQLPRFEPGTMVSDVSLATAITPAAILGRPIEWTVSASSLALLMVAAWRRRRSARG